MDPSLLKPGDVLLYTFNRQSAYSWAIRVKTGSKITHAELFMGDGLTITAKAEMGVNFYAFEPKLLGYVLRPVKRFNRAACLKWFQGSDVQGQPYGWLDLGAFVDLPVDGPGMVCSAVTSLGLRKGGIPCLGDEDPKKIAPKQLRWVESLSLIWKAQGAE